MSVKQKLLAVFLTVICLGIVFYAIFIYGENTIIPEIKKSRDYQYIIEHNPTIQERYKIVNIIYEDNEIYVIVHLDNGNFKIVKVNEAYIDPTLKNINSGYLYRENNQIYIRPE